MSPRDIKNQVTLMTILVETMYENLTKKDVHALLNIARNKAFKEIRVCHQLFSYDYVNQEYILDTK